jgi:hypothetical protein
LQEALTDAKMSLEARLWWLMPIILPTQQAEIRRIMVQSQPRQRVVRPYLEKTHQKKVLLEWQLKRAA